LRHSVLCIYLKFEKPLDRDVVTLCDRLLASQQASRSISMVAGIPRSYIPISKAPLARARGVRVGKVNKPK